MLSSSRATRVLAGTARLVGLVAVALVFLSENAYADTVATPTGTGTGGAVSGTIGGSPRHVGFAGLIRVDINGTPTWVYCIDINHGLQFNQPHEEGSWAESNVPNLAK